MFRRENNGASRVGRFGVAGIALVLVAAGIWAQPSEPNNGLLTLTEVEWLRRHPDIRLAPTPDYQPVEFFDAKGNYAGMTANYFRLIEQRLGYRFKIVRPTPAQWQELDPQKRGADVITASAATPKREEYWSFTETYLELPTYVITRDTAKDDLTLNKMAGARVAVVRGWAAEEFLRTTYTNLMIVPVNDAPTGLRQVSFGLVDAFVSELPVATAWMEAEGISNLKASAEAGYTYRLGISVRKDWPDLASILDKALATITSDERRQIFDRWVKLKTPEERRQDKIREELAWGAAGLAALLAAMLLWNRLLAWRVRVRTLEVQLSEEKFSKAFRASPDGLAISELETGRYIEINDGYCQLFGFTRAEMLAHTSLELGLWENPQDRAKLVRGLKEHGEVRNLETHMRTRSGQPRIILLSADPIEVTGKACLVSVLHDVTDRVLAERALRESEEKFSKAFRVSPDAISITDLETGRFIEINDSFERFFQCKRDHVIGRTAREMAFWAQPADRDRLLEMVRRDGFARDFRTIGRTTTGELRVGLISAELVQITNRRALVLLARDITEKEKAEELDRLQIKVLQMIADGRPVNETLDTLLRMVESQSPEMLTSILLLDPDGVHMRHGAAPSLPAEFLKAIDGFAIGPAVGCCGAAAFRREPVYAADIANDPLWAPFTHLVLPHGLRACWSTPIFDQHHNVLGTFAIYYRRVALPDKRHLQLINMVAHTAAICISKHQSETEREEAVTREQQARIEYTLKLLAAQEAERKRIAAELHDSMGQNLLLIKNLAQMALRHGKPEENHEQVATINQLAGQCIAEARRISHDLHPYQLDHLGLKRALEAMLENAAQASPIQFTSKFETVDELFSTDAAMNLYRIVQESLNNILKHAQARHVNIRLERDIHEVQLRIEDDGRGFNLNQADDKKGLGLQNIAERTRMLGGKLAVDSAPGQGTRIAVAIPVAEHTD